MREATRACQPHCVGLPQGYLDYREGIQSRSGLLVLRALGVVKEIRHAFCAAWPSTAQLFPTRQGVLPAMC
jgi:hypothetical protein